MNANERGVSLGEAAKGALKPAMQAAVEAVAESFQGGVGKQATAPNEQTPARTKRKSDASIESKVERKRSKRTKRSKSSKSKSGSLKQKGRGRKKAPAKRVYNGTQLGGKVNKKRTAIVRKSAKVSNQFTNF
jgi:hypothetical protein